MFVRGVAAVGDAEGGVEGFARHPAPGVIRAAFHRLPRRVGDGKYGTEIVAGDGVHRFLPFVFEEYEGGGVGAAEEEAFGHAGGGRITFVAAKVGADGQEGFRRIRCRSVSAHADAVVSGVVLEGDAAVSALDFQRSLGGGVDQVEVFDGRSLLDVRNGVGLAGGFVAVGAVNVGLGEDIAVRVVGHGVHAACCPVAVGGQAVEVVVGISVRFPCPVVGLGKEVTGKSVEIVGDVHDSCGRPPDGYAGRGVFVGARAAADGGGGGIPEGVGIVQAENGRAVPELFDGFADCPRAGLFAQQSPVGGVGHAGNLACCSVGDFQQDKLTAVILLLPREASLGVVGIFRSAAVAAADGGNFALAEIGVGDGVFGRDGSQLPVEAVVGCREDATVGVRFPDDVACGIVFYEVGAEGRVSLTCGATVFVVVKNGRDVAGGDGLFGVAVGTGVVVHRAGRVGDGGRHFLGAVLGGFPRCADSYGGLVTGVLRFRYAALRGNPPDGAVVFVVNEGVEEDFIPNRV
ncbi:hypothetical protein Barb6XT_02794 [Bacteroidales bacterium Barb6XT]|nr:hypothetical protein Barb6XT_02794 [Bacteroidales bacterium Barb6XT]